jgi:H+/Cl- antiporter ClcA
MIGLFTHLAYFGDVGWNLVAPNLHHRGNLSVIIPVMGGVIVGLIAKYGTNQVRGHGIPEAILAILQSDSKMNSTVALYKPLASAIAIGTRGPFGAEGPIITTGGAVGSLLAQFFALSPMERRTLLAAGAASGMAAVFAAPVAALLLAIEVLLFEWRPRSLIPVALAGTVSDVIRSWLLGSQPIFASPSPPLFSLLDLAMAAAVGLAAGLLAASLSQALYASEALYQRLPLPKVWWPAVGGLVVGLGGLVDPLALGVGYPTIRALDSGHLAWSAALTLLVVKAIIWLCSLSSGTSGGVLAPLLMIGGAFGTLVGAVLPGHPVGFFAIIGMTATLSGSLQIPLTAAIFAMETTHAWSLFLPVSLSAVTAMAVTVLCLPRSILTEKVARRGAHVSREYAVHPLEGTSVGDVMVPWQNTVHLTRNALLVNVQSRILRGEIQSHRAYPVWDEEGHLGGVIRRSRLLAAWDVSPSPTVGQMMEPMASANQLERVRSAAERLIRLDAAGFVVLDASLTDSYRLVYR